MSRASKASRAFRGRDRGSVSTQDGKPSGTAKDRALRLLGVRWRSAGELRRRLALAGFPPEEVEVALSELERAGLVDDERFARELVRDQVGRRMSGSRAIRAALRQKDVPTSVAEAALAEAGDDDRPRGLPSGPRARVRPRKGPGRHRTLIPAAPPAGSTSCNTGPSAVHCEIERLIRRHMFGYDDMLDQVPFVSIEKRTRRRAGPRSP